MTDEGPDPSTVCPRCAVGCHLEPGDGGRASGRPGPANPNGRLCAKGVAAFEPLDDRLTEPLVRRDGELVAASWETAYDRVAEGFRRIRDRHGPDALAFLGAPHCTNEENYLLQKLARTLGTNNVDNRARLCHSGTARALSERVGWPATTNGLDDVGDADVILVAGANPAKRQPVAFNSFVRPAVADGTTLVHVDPVGNETTRLADVHLAPRPGTDATVFDLLAAGVVEAGGVDREFVAERTRGYEAFAAALGGSFDREAALSAAGVDPATLDRVADRIASADRVAAMVGTGVEGGEGPANAPDSLLNLLLLTGNLGRRGTGLHVLRGLVNEQGATDAGCVPDRLPGHRSVTDPNARDRVAEAWGTAPPADPGMTATELLGAFGDEVRGALVVGENPAVSKRQLDWVRDRLDALDLLAVVEVAESETTRHADVVLPAASGVEKAGTVTNLDRHVQRLRPTASPPSDARPDAAVLRDLGKRLLPDSGHFDYESVGEVFDELTAVAPPYAGATYAEISETPRRWPFDRDGVLYRESFDTPDGLAPFEPPGGVAEPAPETGLVLVTGGRSSDADDAGDRTVRLHPDDAADRGVERNAPVLVTDGDTTVDATATLDDGVRRGAAYVHAVDADPFLRCGATTVDVRPRDGTSGSTE
ncbi:molybdopterin oxidoreductase family protein [Halostella litorea]|uniref:molybdopterin oxidoreductase family protein n=1 Tax=Halostella litorea TaxID=2528831 RepID=UPI001091DB8E|nr:molybdopterin-dependent oxidoreductase [Halostella litorea]